MSINSLQYLAVFDATQCGNDPGNLEENCIIVEVLNPIVLFLMAGVGLVVVIMLAVASIQYLTARGNPQNIAAAKHKILNAVIALVLYLFMSFILNWLIPGGVPIPTP